MAGISDGDAPWLPLISEEHREEVRRYETERPWREDPECRAYARALSGARDDVEPFLLLPDPADPMEDVRALPGRFRESFDRLPDSLKPRVARRFRRLMALHSRMQEFRATATPEQQAAHAQMVEELEDLRERHAALMAPHATR